MTPFITVTISQVHIPINVTICNPPTTVIQKDANGTISKSFHTIEEAKAFLDLFNFELWEDEAAQEGA